MNVASLKVFLRRFAVQLCRHLMAGLSRPYEISPLPALILAPHQDDETLACGSLIARKRHEGHETYVVFLTDGGASHREQLTLSVEELVQTRRREALAALGVLGVDSACVQFWNEPDGTLNALSPENREALVARLTALLRTTRPGRVFVPCSPDGSSEHDPVLGMAEEALARADQQSEIWQYPVWCWWNPVLLLTKLFRPGDIYRLAGEDYQILKQKALRHYRSQLEPRELGLPPPLPPELKEFCLQDPEYFFVTRPKRATSPVAAP